MSTALEITSSVTTLIENITTLTNHVKDVKNVPKEITQCLKELRYLTIYLFAVKELIPLSTENDPWLKTLEHLFTPMSNDPDDTSDAGPKSGCFFKEIEELLDGLNKTLKIDHPQWKMAKKRLLWMLTKESVAEDLKKIERFRTLAMSAVQLDAIKLSHAIKDMLGNVKRTGEDTRRIIEKKQMDETSADVLKWLASGTLDHNEVQLKTLKKHVSNTGQWFLELPEFMN
ncbi:hypothetical protein EDD18DRAFT_702019 [Armillaria luteobubalina]|uniref:Uncharacterized protein n=1 Tax=Armillaria luteobubalina TaxID=153913 RepID=A0AA39UJH5_9AGAR|nr:hypothetical protein EDD18DRAFT_702019 [Armillaria luteobubalina]